MDDLRVAVIDRDTSLLRVLSNRTQARGWQLRLLAAPPPPEELAAMRLSALVLDMGLLGPRAWDYLERVSAELPELGLVVCTGQSTVAQRVRGLGLGADDWLAKPCHPEELIARVEAVTRRRRHATPHADAAPLGGGELEIRSDQFQAFAHGRSADLTRREFELLHLLAAVPGQVLEREEIYQRVWGYTMAHGDRSVDVFVRKVRQKLQRVSPDWRYIHTHFGIGYRFDPEPRESPSPVPEPSADVPEYTPEGAEVPI